jgi:hypothetical protein
MIKATLKILICFGLYLGLQQLIELSTHGFCLQRILADDLPRQTRWETPPLSSEQQSEIDRLLSQPYRMLGAGSECFAFASEDGTAVIKFFKLDHARPVYFHRGIFLEDHSQKAGTLSNHPLTTLSLPGPLQGALKRFLGIREFRLERTFQSIKLAYDALREETGLIYLHLNPTIDLHRTLTLYDACGIRHEVPLDSAKFFLQKRATPTEKHFAQLKKTGDHKSAEASVDSLIQMILTRCCKGFGDRDIINRNIGFIGTQAIEIDSGSFLKNSRMREPWLYKQELFYATLELKLWMKKHYPEMVQYLEDRISEEIYRDV